MWSKPRIAAWEKTSWSVLYRLKQALADEGELREKERLAAEQWGEKRLVAKSWSDFRSLTKEMERLAAEGEQQREKERREQERLDPPIDFRWLDK